MAFCIFQARASAVTAAEEAAAAAQLPPMQAALIQALLHTQAE